MRMLLVALALSTLGGCALWMPGHDPEQAWIDLQPLGESRLHAVAVDDRPLKDGRYFQVTPGSHRLGVRSRFEVDGANIGAGSEVLQRDCRLTLEYGHFSAGVRYRLVAGGYGFRPWARLYDPNDQLLARGVERGCGGPLKKAGDRPRLLGWSQPSAAGGVIHASAAHSAVLPWPERLCWPVTAA